MSEDAKTYEISYLVKDSAGEQEVLKVLNQNQAEILRQGVLSEIRLAYPIKKHQSAQFGFVQFAAMPENVVQIKSALSLSPQILRILVISISKPTEAQKPLAKKPEPEIKEAPSNILSNEALEKKLEEILQ